MKIFWYSGLAMTDEEIAKILPCNFIRDLQIAFRRGVEQERERCAKIADRYNQERGTDYGQLGDAAEEIARRIRSGK